MEVSSTIKEYCCTTVFIHFPPMDCGYSQLVGDREVLFMEKTIALIPGDGIGPDIVREGVRVLDAVAAKFGHQFTYKTVLAGGAAIDATGGPLPDYQRMGSRPCACR